MGKMFFALLAGVAELEREMRIALGRRGDGESVTSIARSLTYKTGGGAERAVSRRALYNAFRAHDTEQAAAGTT